MTGLSPEAPWALMAMSYYIRSEGQGPLNSCTGRASVALRFLYRLPRGAKVARLFSAWRRADIRRARSCEVQKIQRRAGKPPVPSLCRRCTCPGVFCSSLAFSSFPILHARRQYSLNSVTRRAKYLGQCRKGGATATRRG